MNVIPGDYGQERRKIRQEKRGQRSALDHHQVQELSGRLCAKLEMLPALTEAEVLMGFIPFQNEVDILPFLKAAYASGRSVVLPRLNSMKEIEAVAFNELCTWEQNSFGVFEPSGEPCPPERIEAIIVPGLAFDPRGYRLGFGKGYYDRFLSRIKTGTFLCGVCYEFQVVDTIYPHTGDIPVHWVVTDHSEIMVDESFF